MVQVYVDGSYNNITKQYGWAYFVLTSEYTLEDSGSGIYKQQGYQIIGNLEATKNAVKDCFAEHEMYLEIHHNYNGVGNFITNVWKPKIDCTKKYVDFIKYYQNKGMVFSFVYSKSHNDNKYTKYVYTLARKTCGLG